MSGTESYNGFRSKIAKFAGLFLAPILFSTIIVGILLIVASVTIGDVFGYASILLMKAPPEEYEVSDFLELAELDSVATDTVHISEITFPQHEQIYGEISVPEVDILCPLIYGDTDKALKRGAGQFIGSSIIGYGGTTLIGAHVNRHFKNLHKVEPGDQVQIRTNYGLYTYEVKYVGVHEASDKSIYNLATSDEKIVLYTCYYEKTALGNVKKRFFACADYVSGPMIIDGSEQQ